MLIAVGLLSFPSMYPWKFLSFQLAGIRTRTSLANSSFWLSFLISCFIVCLLSNKIGRRRVPLSMALIHFVITLALTFVQDIYQFIGVRFICGFFHNSVITLSYILAMVMISPSKRAKVGMMTTPSFCMGCLLCSLVALCYKNPWKKTSHPGSNLAI